jgi:hypothetical protein
LAAGLFLSLVSGGAGSVLPASFFKAVDFAAAAVDFGDAAAVPFLAGGVDAGFVGDAGFLSTVETSRALAGRDGYR